MFTSIFVLKTRSAVPSHKPGLSIAAKPWAVEALLYAQLTLVRNPLAQDEQVTVANVIDEARRSAWACRLSPGRPPTDVLRLCGQRLAAVA